MTVDGNAHVERHVRRRRRGGRGSGEARREGCNGARARGWAEEAGGEEEGRGLAFGPGAHRGMLY